MCLEILKCGEDSYEVLDYYGVRIFEGTEAQCEDFVTEYEEDSWSCDDDDSGVD